jgi:hypothetical protein
MCRIAVLERNGCEIRNDVQDGLFCLNRAGIEAHAGQEELGYGLLWIHDPAKASGALKVLREHGLEVVEKPD